MNMMNMDRFEKWELETDTKIAKTKIAKKKEVNDDGLFGNGIAAQFGVKKKPPDTKLANLLQIKRKKLNFTNAKVNENKIEPIKRKFFSSIDRFQNEKQDKKMKIDSSEEKVKYSNPDYNSDRHARVNAWVKKHFIVNNCSEEHTSSAAQKINQPSMIIRSEPIETRVTLEKVANGQQKTQLELQSNITNATKIKDKKTKSKVESIASQDSKLNTLKIKEDSSSRFRKIRPALLHSQKVWNTRHTQTDCSLSLESILKKEKMTYKPQYKVDLRHDQFLNRFSRDVFNCKGENLNLWFEEIVSTFKSSKHAADVQSLDDKCFISLNSRFNAFISMDLSKLELIPEEGNKNEADPIRIFTKLNQQQYSMYLPSETRVPDILVTRLYKIKDCKLPHK